MERLYKMRFIIGFGLFLFLSPAGFGATPFCSLVVTVSSAHGNRLESQVSVEESGGRVTERETKPGTGTAEFCDLGIVPVVVKVGDDGSCNQVVVKEVPLRWNETFRLAVTYEPDACAPDIARLSVRTCAVMLRVSDAKGTAVPAAVFRGTGGSGEQGADGYGRLLVRLSRGRSLLAMISAPGFKDAQVPMSCPRDLDYGEQTIKLERVAVP